ncbi:hypothetical protein H7I53_17935 [Mycolicibacterium pulveris]|uniref:hypothetical protein n=1 Tax=Mycolicibacterium pulveris TaxID=36813 RepID=UPI0021F35E65|nr:hypothetical protein [Mycolicibacterium pulveris]MCV6982098.1 hypothetical protein [Mycolicibacterium pulveris]
MPVGVNVSVEGGVATIDFVDRSQRGVGIGRLLRAAGDPGLVEKRTGGPRPVYRVPVRVAAKAGMIDRPTRPAAPQPPAAPSRGYDDGWPDMDWSRRAINEFAGAAMTPPLDVTGEPNKRAALDAIEAHRRANPGQ